MSNRETRWEAYARILAEVIAEMPGEYTDEQYNEYLSRCSEWKRERGIR